MSQSTNLIAISNNLNSIRTTQWTKVEDNIFFGLLSCFYKEGKIIPEIQIEKRALIELVGYTLRSNRQFAETLDQFWERIKFIDVKDTGKNAKGKNFYKSRALFTGLDAEWSDDFAEMELRVALNAGARDLLMEKNDWMKIDFSEYKQINSMKARALYRLCCQWANIGRVRVSVEELMFWMELPKSYTLQQNMQSRVFKPFIKECSPFFENLSVKTLKTKDRTSKVYAYEITFKPRFVGAFIEGKYSKEVTEEQIRKALDRQTELYEHYDTLGPKEKRELMELNDWIFKNDNKLEGGEIPEGLETNNMENPF